MKENTLNMTSGSPIRLIMKMAFPLMLGNIFQQLYTVVDTIVVGKGLGIEGLAALGNAEWFVYFIFSITQGFTMGFGIRLSQEFGADNRAGFQKAFGNTCFLSFIFVIAQYAFSFSTLNPVLKIMQTPDEIRGMTFTYLVIIFSGIPITMAYNVSASVLRSVGNSRDPFIAMVISSLINVSLDLLFVMVFHWGVAGAAIATVIAQAAASAYCIISLCKIQFVRFAKKDLYPDRALIKALLIIGTPMGLLNGMIAVGGVVVQRVLNRLGVLMIAGFTATNKLYGILEIAAGSYGAAMTTYAGQNLGSGKPERIKKGVLAANIVGFVTSALIAVFMLIFGKFILQGFIAGDPKEAEETLHIAYRYLSIMCAFLPILYFLYVFRATVQGLGDTFFPMFSGVAEFLMRITCVLFLPVFFGDAAIYWAEVAAWAGADVVLISSYLYDMKHLDKFIARIDKNKA